jgi:hypothetical protein
MNTKLNENFVPAKLKDLKLAMKQDPELTTFIKTKAKKLPPKYRFLIEELIKDYSDTPLFDLMDTAMTFKRFKGGKLISLFSKTNGKITGFAAYVDNRRNEVSYMKLFSLSKKPNAVLLRDLSNLLKELTSKYGKVSWSAKKNNPANKIYMKAIKKYNGAVKETDNEFEYTITKQNEKR